MRIKVSIFGLVRGLVLVGKFLDDEDIFFRVFRVFFSGGLGGSIVIWRF